MPMHLLHEHGHHHSYADATESILRLHGFIGQVLPGRACTCIETCVEVCGRVIESAPVRLHTWIGPRAACFRSSLPTYMYHFLENWLIHRRKESEGERERERETHTHTLSLSLTHTTAYRLTHRRMQTDNKHKASARAHAHTHTH